MFTSKGCELLDSLGLNTPQNKMKNALWNALGNYLAIPTDPLSII